MNLSRVPVCDSCWNRLPAQTGALCFRCGENLGLPSGHPLAVPDLLCRLCRNVDPPFEKAVAHGVYQGEMRTLLHLLKFDGMQPIASRLSALIVEHLLAMPGLPQALTLVPVPLHKSRRRDRGFNQAELLARGVFRCLGRRRPGMQLRLGVGVLERQRATESQAGLSPRQRRANLRGAFFVRTAGIRGQHVLLIDDIYTTGATARACSQALRRAGAASVRVATVARAQRYEALEASAPELPMHQDVAFWGPSQTAVEFSRGRDVAR